ncbi:hypothetical protein PR048_024271 [Dryococelus australis]|uniref:DDE Tnp4 domain-containing protein n=1 Tax=Dryococelus australis TaxID=614101 RepID=A0ABQ9GN56_9NEOP|nr:hypothetical protein PR048_024271 [Dryococelus australis]
MCVPSFDDLLVLVGQRITYQTNNMRKPVYPEERLAVTISLTTLTLMILISDTWQLLHFATLRVSVGDKHCREYCERHLENERKQFYENTHFPNCVGAVDGKHVHIANPSNAGSQYFNYKHFFSIIRLALVDADYCFLAVMLAQTTPLCWRRLLFLSRYVGADYCFLAVMLAHMGRPAILMCPNIQFWAKKIEGKQMNLPPSKQLPNDKDGIRTPYVIVGDKEFALS